MANEKGVWRTIGGRRVFIKEGQDLASAMKESGKFKSASKGTAKKEDNVEKKDIVKETEKEALRKANENAQNISDEKKLEFQKLKQKYIESGKEEDYQAFLKYEKDNNMTDYTISKDYNKDSVESLQERMKSQKTTNGKNPIEDMANDRIKEKENTLNNDKILLDGMKKRGMNEINGTTQADLENRIKKNEDYLKVASNKEDSKKMTAPLGKEDDIGKTPYEKGEKYRNSIIETAKNSKEDNVTLDTETGKVATFDKGYSVSFQQSSDNYDDKEYYEKVEECRNKCDGKLYAGKYGGDAEASFHTDDIETAKELMYKYNQESIYDWEHETLIMNDKYDSSSNKTNYEAEKSTNDIMNEKIRSRGKAEDDLPKHVEIKTQGTSNRKEVSENIQAHILEHYDSPEDFIEQMDAYDWKPTMWHRGEALAEDGFYEIYYEDQRKFLDGLKINPKGKNFSDDRVFQTYKSLIGRESAKLYNRIQKNSYKKYMKAHPLSKMSFEEFKNMRGGK